MPAMYQLSLRIFLSNSLTRSEEISPFLHNFQSFGRMFDGLFSIWQNFD